MDFTPTMHHCKNHRCCSCLLQGNYRQACSSSYPSGPVAPENLLECFERGSASERLEPGWNSVMLHSACTDLEDDEKSLWDHDGRDRCIGVWKDAAGNWLLAAFKPPTTEQIDNCEKLMPVPLEAVGGAVCGKLHSRVLLQVSIDMDKIPQADRATLQHALQLQQVACALQQCGRNNTQHAFRRVPQEACQASRRPMPLCGFPFQERICLALVPQEPNTARSSSRSYASVAAAGHVIPEEDVCMAEHGYLSSLQKVGKSRVTARWNDVQRDSMMWGEPLVGGSVALFVGTGNLSTRLQGPNSSRYANVHSPCHIAMGTAASGVCEVHRPCLRSDDGMAEWPLYGFAVKSFLDVLSYFMRE